MISFSVRCIGILARFEGGSGTELPRSRLERIPSFAPGHSRRAVGKGEGLDPESTTIGWAGEQHGRPARHRPPGRASLAFLGSTTREDFGISKSSVLVRMAGED
jgi:hypothetical protein